ncbi:MAG: hypothetical protein WDZ59_13220 [Pirellulales bacterium]
MDRSQQPVRVWSYASLLIVLMLIPSAGCHRLLATVFYAAGAGDVPAECTELVGKRVVVVCRPPSSYEFSHASAPRDLSRQVGRLLDTNVKDIDVVNPADVDNWFDASDGEDFKELAQAVDADMVVHIELADFDLYKGQTLYQGHAEVQLSVYDMTQGGEMVWEKPLGEVLYPVNSGVPVHETTLDRFHRKYVTVLSEQIARHFYAHDPHLDFAIDATAAR